MARTRRPSGGSAEPDIALTFGARATIWRRCPWGWRAPTTGPESSRTGESLDFIRASVPPTGAPTFYARTRLITFTAAPSTFPRVLSLITKEVSCTIPLPTFIFSLFFFLLRRLRAPEHFTRVGPLCSGISN
jgi:hypothetical protein